MRPNQSRKVRNYAVGGGALVIAGAIVGACTVTGTSTDRAGSSLTFDPLPSSPASAAPGAGLNPGAVPGQSSSAPSSPAPRTMTVVVPPPAAQGNQAKPVAPAPPPAPTAPAGAPSAPVDAPKPGPSPTSVPPGPVAKPVYLPDGSVDCAKSKCVALTFSGGPGPATRQFLQTLDQYNARGTFFVTGAQVTLNPDIMVAISGTGNEVANGTWSQPDMTTLSAAENDTQLAQTNAAVKQTVGITPTLFRPMGGHTSQAVVDAGKKQGLSQVLWDLDTRDYNYQNDPDGLTTVLKTMKPGQIVMLHDTFLASATALDRALADLTNQGYAFVTVSQLLRTRSAG